MEKVTLKSIAEQAGVTLVGDELNQLPAGEYKGMIAMADVLNALADKYLELADYIETILLEQGPAIVPALKNGFDSAGQADMVRRVRLVAMLAGGRENDWFVSILPASVKKIREAVIHSLGYSQENGPLLMDLCRTERGKLKEAAMRSLAMMEDEACLALLREEVGKKPENVGFLRGIDSAIAADLTTQAVRTRMERFREEDEGCGQMQWARVVELMDTVVGMYSPGMEQFWHWASRYMVECEEHSPSVVEILKENFMHTVLRNPRTEVLALARSLAAENGRWFLGSAFLADMMELSPEALCDRYGPMIDRTGQETEEQQNVRCQILSGLSVVRWDRQLRRYVQSFLSVQPMTGKRVPVTRVMEGLDPRWLGVLVDPAISDEGYVNNLHESGIAYQASYKRDALICQLIDEDNPTVCRLVGAWLHCNTVNQGNIMRYFNPMLRCGWKNWKGLLVHCVVKSGHVSYGHVMKWIQKTPISNAEKAEELRQVDMLVREGKLRLGMFRWPGDQVRECIAALEADPNWQVEWRGFM